VSKYLCVPASISVSKRICTSGKTVSKKKSCLKPHRVDKLVFCYMFLKYYSCDYNFTKNSYGEHFMHCAFNVDLCVTLIILCSTYFKNSLQYVLLYRDISHMLDTVCSFLINTAQH